MFTACVTLWFGSLAAYSSKDDTKIRSVPALNHWMIRLLTPYFSRIAR